MTTKGGYVDFHCHLDLYSDHELAIREAEERGVFTLSVTTTPLAWPRNKRLTENTRYVRAALGLHPQLVQERSSEISMFEQYLGETRYIGEIGLDAGPKFYKSIELQTSIFQRILRSCAREGKKILSIHSVRAVARVLDALDDNFPTSAGIAVLHWFTGTPSEARRAIGRGCYFSFNSEMLKKEAGLKLLSLVPTDRILTETDGPFTSFLGRPSRPTDVSDTVDRIASGTGMSVPATIDAIRANLRRVLDETASDPSRDKERTIDAT